MLFLALALSVRECNAFHTLKTRRRVGISQTRLQEDDKSDPIVSKKDDDDGIFKLKPKSLNFIGEKFESTSPRTGGDGDKVILFTIFSLVCCVQYFLFVNHDLPPFESYTRITR